MPEIPVSLIKGDAVDDNVDYRDNLPVNMFAVPRKTLGSDAYFINYYGLSLFGVGAGVDRGAIWVSRDGFEGHYRVSGEKLISVGQNGVVTELGDIPGSDQVSMDYSFNNLAIVASGRLYYYNQANGFREIVDPDVGAPIDIVWVDGYFFLTDGESIYHSNIADEEVYDPLAFGNSQFQPDPSRGLGKNEDNEILVFGQFTVEYFVNVGSDPFAFQRIQRKSQKIGIAGTHCKAELEAKWYVLGRRKETAFSFHVVTLGNEQTISTRETDKVLATYTDEQLALVTMDVWKIDNVALVIYHLPSHTLMFNVTTAERFGVEAAWSILKTDINGDDPCRAKNYILDERNNKWIAGDRLASNIGEVRRDICTQYDEVVEWLLFSPFLKIEKLSIDKLEIETIPGVAPNNDAKVFFSISQDGRTFGNEWYQLYGENLDYGARFIMRRLGYIRDWCGFKFRGANSARVAFGLMTIKVT